MLGMAAWRVLARLSPTCHPLAPPCILMASSSDSESKHMRQRQHHGANRFCVLLGSLIFLPVLCVADSLLSFSGAGFHKKKRRPCTESAHPISLLYDEQ